MYRSAAMALSRSWSSFAHYPKHTGSPTPSVAAAGVFWLFVATRFSPSRAFEAAQKVQLSVASPTAGKLHFFEQVAAAMGEAAEELFGMWLEDTLSQRYFSDPVRKQHAQHWFKVASKHRAMFHIDPHTLMWSVATTLSTPGRRAHRFCFDVVDVHLGPEIALPEVDGGAADYVPGHSTWIAAFLATYADGTCRVSHDIEDMVTNATQPLLSLRMAVGFV
jgi:hypothetical protein